jgi:signal transduction histidine kinase
MVGEMASLLSHELNQPLAAIASYANGDPMAIVQGSVGLIGCHLESQKHWYSKKVMQPHWHENTHHPLLWQFVANHLLQTQQMTLF